MKIQQDIDFFSAFLDPQAKERPTVISILDPTKADESPYVHQDEPDEDVFTDDVEPATGRLTGKNFIQHEDADPYALNFYMFRKYGVDWLDWEPETIEQLVERDIDQQLIFLNLSKLMAIRTLQLVDGFWQRWEMFSWLCLPLSGFYPEFKVLTPPTMKQIAVAVDIANIVRNDVDWSDEVRSFVEQVMRFEGVILPPESVDFVDFNAEDYPIDETTVKADWLMMRGRDKPLPDNDESPEVTQLNKLWEIHQTLLEERKERARQLSIVKAITNAS